MVRGHRRDRPAGADLTPNGIVRDAQATSQLIKSEIFIVRQRDIPINSRIRPPCWIINRYYRESMKAASMGALSEIFAVMNRN